MPIDKYKTSYASKAGASQAPQRWPTTPSTTRTPGPAPAQGVPPWRQNSMAPKSVAPRFNAMRNAANARASQVNPTLASAMQNLNIANNNSKVPPAPPSDCYDPSMGPPPVDNLQNAWQGSACPTINTNMTTYNMAVMNATCKRTTRTINDFKQGQIISVPYHTPNLNPMTKANHPRLTLTCEGPAFSKRRLFLILFKYIQDMFCVPLYTFEGKGLDSKPEELKVEYVYVKNKAEKKFRNAGKFQPVEVETYDPKKPMKETSCIQLTGGVKINVSEHIGFVGRCDQASFTQLVTLVEQRNKIARRIAWEPDEPKPRI